jgi:hypothetical protein
MTHGGFNEVTTITELSISNSRPSKVDAFKLG